MVRVPTRSAGCGRSLPRTSWSPGESAPSGRSRTSLPSSCDMVCGPSPSAPRGSSRSSSCSTRRRRCRQQGSSICARRSCPIEGGTRPSRGGRSSSCSSATGSAGLLPPTRSSSGWTWGAWTRRCTWGSKGASRPCGSRREGLGGGGKPLCPSTLHGTLPSTSSSSATPSSSSPSLSSLPCSTSPTLTSCSLTCSVRPLSCR
mmetsp:Transcript_1455/g.4406  ORF Transcript_1455/g.4406 Transcript_1455/m.4406 type:complete len:202 (+) Transcript_1455:79-684(+)